MNVKDKLKGLTAGLIIGSLVTGGIVTAKKATETLEVTYSDIKIYKDNVPVEVKDVTGKVIEPFIYQGTTYLPVRGTSELAGMEVTWDGATRSVYLWDNIMPDGAMLLEVCMPYRISKGTTYLGTKSQYFNMAGKKYTDGFVLYDASSNNSTVFFNLDGKFSEMSCVVGHIDGQETNDTNVNIYLDGNLFDTITVKGNELPKNISIPCKDVLQLQIKLEDPNGKSNYADIGFGNIIIK